MNERRPGDFVRKPSKKFNGKLSQSARTFLQFGKKKKLKKENEMDWEVLAPILEKLISHVQLFGSNCVLLSKLLTLGRYPQGRNHATFWKLERNHPIAEHALERFVW